MAWNAIPTRPNVKPTEQVMTLIAPSHCWHFDAWLYEGWDRDTLVLKTETRAGGRNLLTSALYVWNGDSLRYTDTAPNYARACTLQDRALIPRAAELDALHSRVLRMAARVPSGFRSRSVALHYVRCPDLPPFDGTEANWQQ